MNVILFNVPKKFNSFEIFNAMIFYGEKLMTKRMLSAIDVKVVFIPNLEEKENATGDCIWEDDNSRPREFMIRLDACASKKKLLTILAHEMVHIKQYTRGEMRDMIRCGRTKWRKKIYDMDKTNYWDLPWEIEAHGREYGLYVRFKDYWSKEKKNAKDAYKAQSYCANSPHTLVCKKGSGE